MLVLQLATLRWHLILIDMLSNLGGGPGLYESTIGGDTQQILGMLAINDRLLSHMGMLAISDRRFSFYRTSNGDG